MLLSLLTPFIKFALNKHFLIIIDTGKSTGMENSGGKKSGGEIHTLEKAEMDRINVLKLCLFPYLSRNYIDTHAYSP